LTDVSEPGPETAQAKRARRLKYALIASLAVNLLVVGAVAGMMFGFAKHRPHFGHGRGEDFGLMGLTRHLPEERRKEIRKDLRADRERLRPLVDEIRAARREAADKLVAEPFDKAALEAAILAAGEKERALRQTAVTSFVGHAERLTASERKMLSEWWLKKNQPFKPRRGKKGKDDEPPPLD
jgi:uncharacterized membrane protein